MKSDMELLKRKIDDDLRAWKNNPDRLPLIVKGARQIGKTASITAFAQANYRHVIAINFVFQSKFKAIFNDGYEVDAILKNISLLDPSLEFVPGDTLFFFDEMQECPACATALKAFKLDGRFDVICSGLLMGINYREIESNSVGYKEDYEMHSMDFEEFLWAKGYSPAQIEEIYAHMRDVAPFSELELGVLFDIFRDYMTIGGMPAVVKAYIDNKNFSGTLQLQRQLLLDYEEDITKYAQGLDKGKIKNIYRHISVFLGQENKKFQITKVARGARNRDYIGTNDPTDPYISPLYGNFEGFPPMLIQVGSYEMLLSDSELVAEKAKKAGCKVRLSIYEGMFHVFQMALLVMPESRRAWREVGKFLEIIQQGLPDSHYETA